MEFFFGAFENEWERRRAALLHERSLGRGKTLEEEERRRRGGAVPTASLVAGRMHGGTKRGRRSAGLRAGFGAGEPSMRSRFASLASGSQPAVVKMASFGGGSRLGAMIGYISRNGDVVVENERGEQLRGRNELSTVPGEWDHLMKNRAESRDIGSFVVEVKEQFDPASAIHEQARAILKRGLGDRMFAFAASPRNDDTGFTIEGVTVLRDSMGERLTGDGKASAIVQGRLDGDEGEQSVAATFRFTGYGNGTDYGSARLRDLVSRYQVVAYDEQGGVIADAKQAGDVVQLKWRDGLHSRKPRDVMHVVLSARAGTDVQAFHAAARGFLAQEFAGYRYVFSLHDPSKDPKPEEAGGKRPHVHVHAIVAMRSDAGDRIETTISVFRRWRVTMAEKARAHGINMEMTDRRERASAAAYGKNQVRPTNRHGRTEHEATSEAAQRRYDAKRSDRHSLPQTERSRRYTDFAKRQWEAVATEHGGEGVESFAQSQLIRLESEVVRDHPRVPGGRKTESLRSQFITHLVSLDQIVSRDEPMRQMSRSEFEAYEKRVETALFQAERVIPANERANFDEIASAAREHVSVRRELMELQEQNGERIASDEPRLREGDNDANVRWDESVARHGLRTVEAANEIMLEVEHYREAIDLADAGEGNANKASLQASLDLVIARVGELGASGNTLIREIAEVDHDLRIAIEAAERSRQRGGKMRQEGNGTSVIQSPAAEAAYRDRDDEPGRVQTDEERAGPVADGTQQTRDGPGPRPGDTTRTDPAQQLIPRLEQLQRETDERQEPERDDRER
ncbi:conjugal transfer protein TraA (plasmid) [Rhizobium sp. T1470]|uniref:conjugal transfer protein TraA n=1 Tax=unclassified Rhizobium TaxID=2613769 RepID=UPI001AAFEAC7|nr:conjugal transfer protein TraA [Rhizobium sp. T1473]MCA0806717.1 conjugal transfer protein TraA [Rhizobium sp. T1473]